MSITASTENTRIDHENDYVRELREDVERELLRTLTEQRAGIATLCVDAVERRMREAFDLAATSSVVATEGDEFGIVVAYGTQLAHDLDRIQDEHPELLTDEMVAETIGWGVDQIHHVLGRPMRPTALSRMIDQARRRRS